ncbi:DUF4142 domain-containing protein [Pannus brasiliensis CCIBt3594]|uniref:DUF4142 domain-containing protein n=1 Tax=Pannus brasiliensis CCIBt3594 TaxID=1427578 RepID=A0AAW9QZ47_9CHRO
MKRQTGLIIASAVLFSVLAVGCATRGDRAENRSDRLVSDRTAASPSTSTSPTTRTGSESNRNVSQSADSPFMMEAARGGMNEVQLGRLAEQKASNPRVKEFGRRMVRDHDRANTKLTKVFDREGMTMPSTTGAKYEATREQLSKLSGAEFDRQYMSRMVEDHTEDVTNFRHEASTGKDPQARAWASQTLPTLEEHLNLAKSINSSLTTTGKK